MKKEKSLKINFIMNLILNVVSIIYPIITFPYVSRVLGTIGIGKVSFATSFISYFITFASLGIPAYGVKVIAQNREDKTQCSKVAHELFIINGLTTLCAYLVFAVCLCLIPKLAEDRLLYVIISTSILLNAFGMEWLYRGLEEYVYITKRTVIFKVLALCGMFLLVRAPKDYYWYAFLTVFASYGSYILNIIHSRKYISYRYIGNYNIIRHLKPVIYLLGATFVTSLYSHLDTTMIGFMINDDANGLYYATVRIRSLLLMCTSALTTVMIPRMSYYIAQNNLEKSEYYIRKTIRAVALISIPLLIYSGIMARECLVFFAGKEYSAATDVLRVQLFSCFLVGFSSIWGNQVLIPFNGENKYFVSVLAGAIVNFVFNYFLIKKIGIFGAAIATLVTETVVLILLKKYSFDYIKVLYSWKPIIPYLSAAMPCGIFVIFLKETINLNTFAKLVVTAITFFGGYALILLLIIKDEMFSQLFKQIIGKFKRGK